MFRVASFQSARSAALACTVRFLDPANAANALKSLREFNVEKDGAMERCIRFCVREAQRIVLLGDLTASDDACQACGDRWRLGSRR